MFPCMGKKEKSSLQSPRKFVREAVLVLVQVLFWYWGKLQNLCVFKLWVVAFWSGMDIYVRTWSELCGLQLVGKFSVYCWDGRKFNPKECNETVFSLQEFTLCFYLSFVIDQVKEWTAWCMMSKNFVWMKSSYYIIHTLNDKFNSVVHQYLKHKPCCSHSDCISF